MRILIADDSEEFSATLCELLKSHGFECVVAHTTAHAIAIVDRSAAQLGLVLLDIEFAPSEVCNGIDVLAHIRRTHPAVPVVMLTGKGTIETAVQATKLGAVNFVDKATVTNDRLLSIVTTYARAFGKPTEREHILEFLRQQGIIASSAVMVEVGDQILRLGRSDINVLITGETGTGKRLVAQAIHAASRRARYSFVVVDVPNIPRELFQSTMFGHRRGAFTGAHTDKRGYFHEANRGTMFLDEIGDLPLDMQANLLIPIEERRIYAVGATQYDEIDVRIISATDRDLVAAIREGRFRDQLYYRLREAEIHLPPLRERREDIPLIAEHCLQQLNGSAQHPKYLSPPAIEFLCEQKWEGNVRQLLGVLRASYAMVGERESIELADIVQLLRPEKQGAVTMAPLSSGTLKHQRDEAERLAICDALQKANGNVTKAAAYLDISREALYGLMKKYAIDPTQFRTKKPTSNPPASK